MGSGPWISYITQMCIICFKVAGDNQEMMCPYRICSEGSAAKTQKKYSHLISSGTFNCINCAISGLLMKEMECFCFGRTSLGSLAPAASLQLKIEALFVTIEVKQILSI